MKKTIIAIMLLMFSFVLINGMDTRPYKKFYTLQAGTMFNKDCQKAHTMYEKLKSEKQMVYYIKDKEGLKTCVRIRSGVFSSIDDAKQAALKFKQDTQITPAIVETTGITITDYKGIFDMVNTSSGIWKWDYKNFIEIKNFGTDFNCETIATENPASISPDGKYILYLYKSNIIKLELTTGKETYLVKSAAIGLHLQRSSPKWAPNGKSIAFLDIMNAKAGTCLRIINADGTNERCIVDNSKKTRAVMSFEWSTKKDEIFFIEGDSTMRMPIGGELYVTGLDGKYKKLIQPEKGTVIYHDFEVDGNALNYSIAVFENIDKDKYKLIDKTLKLN